MRFSINRDFTKPHEVEQVKSDISDFKASWTENDLLSMFAHCTGEKLPPEDKEFINCNVSAFPGGSFYENKTHYRVEMLVKYWNEIYDISFYTDGTWNVFLKTEFGDIMYKCIRYIPA